MKITVYEQVTNYMIEQLESGIVPWRSPYFSKIGYPINFASGKPYRGINVFLLASREFTSPYFLTFVQAKELGGRVKKGERGSFVIKYGTFNKESEDSENGEEERRYLKSYIVFNSSQIDGVEFPTIATPDFIPSEQCSRAESIISNMPLPPEIKTGFACPAYERVSDTVRMPEKAFFDSEEVYFGTLFHELGHATGHESRLARKSLLENRGIDATGDARKIYAEEELVAEMTAAFLITEAGIKEDKLENSAAYLRGWIDVLKSKSGRGWIIKAASEAQKAADFILGIDT